MSKVLVVSLILVALSVAIHYSGVLSGGQSQVDLTQFKQDGWFGRSLKGKLTYPQVCLE